MEYNTKKGRGPFQKSIKVYSNDKRNPVVHLRFSGFVNAKERIKRREIKD